MHSLRHVHHNVSERRQRKYLHQFYNKPFNVHVHNIVTNWRFWNFVSVYFGRWTNSCTHHIIMDSALEGKVRQIRISVPKARKQYMNSIIMPRPCSLNFSVKKKEKKNTKEWTFVMSGTFSYVEYVCTCMYVSLFCSITIDMYRFKYFDMVFDVGVMFVIIWLSCDYNYFFFNTRRLINSMQRAFYNHVKLNEEVRERKL